MRSHQSSFCGPLQRASFLWNDRGNDFSNCFEVTVLRNVPLVLLLIYSLVYLWPTYSLPSHYAASTGNSLFRNVPFACSIFLAMEALTLLVLNLLTSSSSDMALSGATYLLIHYPLQCFCWGLSALFLSLFVSRRLPVSRGIACFWLAEFVLSLKRLESNILHLLGV